MDFISEGSVLVGLFSPRVFVCELKDTAASWSDCQIGDSNGGGGGSASKTRWKPSVIDIPPSLKLHLEVLAGNDKVTRRMPYHSLEVLTCCLVQTTYKQCYH